MPERSLPRMAMEQGTYVHISELERAEGERDSAYAALRTMASACGIPDPAEACRMVLSIYRGTAPGQEAMNRGW